MKCMTTTRWLTRTGSQGVGQPRISLRLENVHSGEDSVRKVAAAHNVEAAAQA